MNIEKIKVTELKEAKYNPRQIDDAMFQRLVKTISEYGLVEPIVINGDNTIIGGHQRCKAAVELGFEEVPCVRVDLDDRNEKALNLALNKISGEWDGSKLNSLLSDFDINDFDVDLTGFDVFEVAAITSFDDSVDVNREFESEFPEETHGKPPEERGYIIQYNLVFNDESEKDAWYQWIKSLKDKYPDADTISERVIKEIESGK